VALGRSQHQPQCGQDRIVAPSRRSYPHRLMITKLKVGDCLRVQYPTHEFRANPRTRQRPKVSLPRGATGTAGCRLSRWRSDAARIWTHPKRNRLTVGSLFSRCRNALSKINAMTTHPFGVVTANAIGTKLPDRRTQFCARLDLVEIRFSRDARKTPHSPESRIRAPKEGRREREDSLGQKNN
jgi:hypothetical protein